MDFEDVIDDFKDNSKKLFKDKKFLIVAGCVAAFALVYGIYKVKKNDDSASDTSALYYSGYPETGGGGISTDGGTVDNSYIESLLSDIQAGYNADISDLKGENAILNSNVDFLSGQLVALSDKTAEQDETIQRQNAISTMRANSELFHFTSDQATKDALHAENIALAEKFGWTYKDGSYYEGSSLVYDIPRELENISGSGKSNLSNSTFIPNVDYQAKIEAAILNGSSATVINNLNAQRNDKLTASGTTNKQTGYDANIDYSDMISKAQSAGADASVIKNLQEQRENKINALYGGKDPGTVK